jgi:hypothetical protein
LLHAQGQYRNREGHSDMNHDHQHGQAGNAEAHQHLAAAGGIFDEMVAVLGAHAPHAGHLIPPFAMALAAAANGRDCVITALPASGQATPARPPRPDLASQPAGVVADTLAGQARQLSARLAAAALAADGQDRDALAAGSGHASAVHDLLAGEELWPPGQPWGSS